MSRQMTKPITVFIDWRDSVSGVTDTSEFLFFCMNESEAVTKAAEEFTEENKKLGYDCCVIESVDAVFTKAHDAFSTF